jgi:hypothetical protein
MELGLLRLLALDILNGRAREQARARSIQKKRTNAEKAEHWFRLQCTLLRC